MRFFPSLAIENYQAVLRVDGSEVSVYWLEQVMPGEYFAMMTMGEERVTMALSGPYSRSVAFHKLLEVASQHYEAQMGYAMSLYEHDRALG